jgi:hypothetical protein
MRQQSGSVEKKKKKPETFENLDYYARRVSVPRIFSGAALSARKNFLLAWQKFFTPF